MAIRVNPKLIEELEHFGSEDVQNCYHCGNCSAVCPHTDDTFVFPRKPMRFLQMGLEKKLERSLTPWLCYYCGQCSVQCPREAEPGETMMSMRRWLTSRYDFSGLAKLFYMSWKFEVAFLAVVALLTGAGLLAYGYAKGDIGIYDGPGAFLPSSLIHGLDLILMAVLSVVLAVNVARMWRLIMADPKTPVPLRLYLKNLHLLPVHFFSQKRYARCDPEKQAAIHMPWLTHLCLMLGYCTMLVLIVLFLDRLQSGPKIEWSVHLFGYLATLGLLAGIVYVLWGRLQKRQVQYRHSHSTDWTFLWLLLYMVVTGVIQHVLHRAGFIEAANLAYVAHLMGVFPWLLRMPFSKWAHLIYRPMAMYFAGVLRESIALKEPRGLAVRPMRTAA